MHTARKRGRGGWRGLGPGGFGGHFSGGGKPGGSSHPEGTGLPRSGAHRVPEGPVRALRRRAGGLRAGLGCHVGFNMGMSVGRHSGSVWSEQGRRGGGRVEGNADGLVGRPQSHWAAGSAPASCGRGPSHPAAFSRALGKSQRQLACPRLTLPCPSPPQGHSKSIQCLTVHRNGGKSYIYSGSHDGHINIL